MAKTKKPPPPDCPSCGDNRAVHEEGDRNYYCTNCRKAFDDDPAEGGDYSTDPTRRLELADERAKRKRQRVEAQSKLPPGFRFSGRARG
jgi:hypothetical protein